MFLEWSSKANDGVAVRPVSAGNRIVLRLFWDKSPLACENFATLCINGGNSLNENGQRIKPAPVGSSGKPLTYRGSNVHRIVPGFIMQGGDFVFGNGSGGESIFNGKKFKDEKAGLQLKHDKKGILSMGNSGKNSNTSQFFITFDVTSQCDNKHVIFGEVISGFEVLDAIEKVGTSSGTPNTVVTITDCGAFHPLSTPGAGYWYDQPDSDSYQGYTPVFMVRPRIAVVAPTNIVCQKFEKIFRSTAVITTISMDDMDVTKSDLLSKKIQMLLDQFSVDIVLLTPVCSDILKTIIYPVSWEKVTNNSCGKISLDEIVLISKPVEAVKVVKEQSWIRNHKFWIFDEHQ